MKMKKILERAVFLAAVLVMHIGCAVTQQADKPADTAWQFHDIVGVDFIKPYAVVPQPEGVMIIDSRPYKPKYVNGHIPTAVNIPDSQFDKSVSKLPPDKNTLLIFYCEGPT